MLLAAMTAADPASAKKPGGTLKIGQFHSPASMSIHKEFSNTAEGRMMGVFNNLVLYDQHVARNSLQSIQPDLATDWSWDDRTRLTFHLGQGVNGMTVSRHRQGCPMHLGFADRQGEPEHSSPANRRLGICDGDMPIATGTPRLSGGSTMGAMHRECAVIAI
jgi:hypothetical protein